MSDTAETVIPATRWPEYCEAWGNAHHGWLVSVRDASGGRVLARQARLRGCSAEDHGLVVVLGLHEDDPFRLLLPDVVRIVERTRDGEHTGIVVDSLPATRTCIDFRVPAAPDGGIGGAGRVTPGRS